ncbi:hypothetical protein HYG81_15415 [Natrinema zhouii]|uniref:Flagellin n=1 Tax=Natrinema zhouii TaxID=1710539 RepID=A0A7D6CN00_9EURY|nr:hypothetical protein [Natrinema zhouii]QLK25457.1 hypothetical protein HYG81_15415 [Natrinema zhouii]
MVTDDRSRGQVILIGAITLAFIILGIVVVFNGVLYTETLSSGSSGQSAADATVTELEIEQGIACVLARGNENIEENITAFNNAYRNATTESTTTAVNISVGKDPSLESTNITITYDSNGISYEQKRMIREGDCLTRGS